MFRDQRFQEIVVKFFSIYGIIFRIILRGTSAAWLLVAETLCLRQRATTLFIGNNKLTGRLAMRCSSCSTIQQWTASSRAARIQHQATSMTLLPWRRRSIVAYRRCFRQWLRRCIYDGPEMNQTMSDTPWLPSGVVSCAINENNCCNNINCSIYCTLNQTAIK